MIIAYVPAIARVVFALLLMVSIPAFAQEKTESTETSAQAEIKPEVQDDSTLAKRVELAKKMHEIRPTREQVNAAIDQVSLMQPENEREAFKSAMREILNYQAIEKISVDSMAETFTVEELEAMVEYYSKPVAKSASDKEGVYRAKVYPEIIRMLDAAMMRVKTGGN